MAIGDNRRRIQVADLDIQKVNEALRQLSDWIARLEGRSGGVNLRDSVTIQSDKQSLIDFESSSAGKASICVFGAENATLAFAKGARKENNGEWVATDTVSVIWALDRAGNGTLYVNTGLAIGQAFTPTVSFVVGTGGSVTNHVLDSSTHTVSGQTTGHVLQALTATTFDFAALTGLNVTNTPAGGIAATSVQGAINELDTEKANLASPTFTGTPAAPTAAVGTSSTQLATTAFVDAEAVAKAGDTMTGDLIVSKGTAAQSSIVVGNNTAGWPAVVLRTGGASYNFLIGAQLNVSNALEITGSTATGGGTHSTPTALFYSVADGYLTSLRGNLTFTGTDPTITFASGDYITYDATNNLYNFYVGSSLAATIKGGSGASGACIIAKGSGFNQNTLTSPAFGQYTSTVGYVQAPSGGQISLWNDNTNSCLDGTDAGDVYIAANCSALSFTDRTPYPKDKDEAYLAIKSHEGKNGKIDHSKLHPSIKTESKHLKINRDADGRPDGTDPVEEISPGRDLSMTVSALTEVVKDLIARIDALEKKA